MSFQNRSLATVQSGRSFYTRPRQAESLTSVYEMWTGLFQSTMLGRIPYVNIDIAHKAFTRETPCLEILKRVSDSVRYGPKFEPGREIPSNILNEFSSDVKGYMIAYQRDPQAPLITKMCMGISDAANRQRFEHQGKQITVEEYFRGMNAPLKFPMYPCLVGPNRSFFPLEHCTLIGGQVN